MAVAWGQAPPARQPVPAEEYRALERVLEAFVKSVGG
jgi:hypothetical protein